MLKMPHPALYIAAALSLTPLASAAPITIPCTTTTCAPVIIAADPNAPTSNFGSPGNTATVGYTIQTSDDGTGFKTVVTTADPSALQFSNLYFDSIASTPNTGSNVAFEVINNRAFDPNKGIFFDLTGTGFTFSDTVVNGVSTITSFIPNSFFLNDPLGIGFAKTPQGTLVSLHLSQSFSYSVVGGSGNFTAPTELGAFAISSASPVPEPATLEYLALSGLGLLTGAGRRFLIRRG